MAEEFTKGETVRLKSGGPVMTVTDTGDTVLHGSRIWTMWFDDKKKMESDFPPEALVKAQPAKATVATVPSMARRP